MIRNKIDASAVINAAISSHSRTWDMAKQTEDYVINMSPPFDDEKLKDTANWSANWNYGKGRAEAQQIITKNSTEITKAISLCDIVFENFDKKKHSKDKVYEFLSIEEMRASFAERIGAAFSESVIERTQKIDTLVKRSEYECTLFGYASVVKDYNAVFPNVIPYTSIAFEDHTNVDDVGIFVVFDCIKGSYIYNILSQIKKDKESKEESYYSHGDGCPSFTSSGWNEDALEEIVCSIYNTKEEALSTLNAGIEKTKDGGWSKKYTTWEDVSLLSKAMGDFWCAINMNNIHLAKVFEIFSNGDVVENYCALSSSTGSEVRSASLITDILFYKKRTNVKQKELINIVRDVTIDGSVYIHDIKGSGKTIGESTLRYDMLRNSIQDKLMLSGSTWVYAPNGIVGNNMKVQVIGGLVSVGQGTEIVPNLIKQDLSYHIDALRIEQSEQQSNMTHIKPNVNLSNRPTKDEVNFINSEALSTRMSDIPQKLKSYSNIITSIFKALFSDDILNDNDESLKEEFISHLLAEFSDLSVEKEDIIKILKCVSIVRVSPVMSDREAISAALGVASTATARQRLTRMFLSTFGFSRSQVKDIMEAESYGRDAELAAIENSMFENTREVVFGIGQDHIAHLQAHFYKIDQKLAGLQSGEDPVRAHLYITNALTNTRLHVDGISKSPFYKDQAKDYIKVQKYFETKLQELASELDAAKQKMQQQQQDGQQQGEPQLDPETKNKFYLDKIKLIEKINSARSRTQVMQEMKQQSFELDQELKKQKAQADIENRKEKTRVDIDSKLAQKSVEMS